MYALDGYEHSTENLDAVSLSSDNVFGDDSGALQLATVTGDATSGYRVSLTVRVDTDTEPTGSAVPGGGAPAGTDGSPSGAPGGTAPSGRGGPGGTPPSGAPGGTPPSGGSGTSGPSDPG